MKPKHIPLVLPVILLGSISAWAGDFSYRGFAGDADSFINSGLNYTAKADFNGAGGLVNGVTFSDTGTSGTGYILSGAVDGFTGNTNNLVGATNGFASNFVYTGAASGNTGNASLVLSGLTPGQNYVTSWYNVGFGGPGGRVIGITPSDTGTPFTFDENYTNGGNGNILRYAFTAPAGGSITYNFDAVVDGNSFHHYAFSNASANTAILATPVISASTGAGPYAPFTVRSNDLLQTHATLTSSSNDFGVEGTGGPSVLTDGIFSIRGGNQIDNSKLMVGNNGSFVEYGLDLGFSPLGYDISSIETYGGWNDDGRDRQLFRILYSLVGSASFTEIGGLDYNPAATSNPSAVRALFGTNLTGVDAIRFEFLAGQENTYAGYGEFDVVGTATVPEPAAMAFIAFGSMVLSVRRRRN